MKRYYITALLIVIIIGCFAQKGTTFKVEDLKPPERLLSVKGYKAILEHLIRLHDGEVTYPLPIIGLHSDPVYDIVAKSEASQDLVTYDYHSFFEGMYAAYADHRPFTLSPDMIWLLICQGFASHVNNNSAALRSLFVDFDGKTSLVVRNDKIKLDNPNSPWSDVFPELSKQIATHTGQQLTDALTADFSTTTPITRIASQITLLNAMKSYFDLIVLVSSCGIPQVTLEGTPEDWQRVLIKTEALRKYKLDWWIDEIEPLLKQFEQASQGKVDQGFWKNMFKYHADGRCGPPAVIDGWIVKFFPYDKAGKRMGLKQVTHRDSLPNEIVKVDVIYEYGDGSGNFVKTPLELWAGFVGLKQDSKTFGLRPEIGWMIRKKDTATFNRTLADKMKFLDSISQGVILRVKTIPSEIFHLGPIKKLEIYFIDGVHIPDEMASVTVSKFKIHGEVTPAEIRRIRKLMPYTKLIINNQEVTDSLFK